MHLRFFFFPWLPTNDFAALFRHKKLVFIKYPHLTILQTWGLILIDERIDQSAKSKTIIHWRGKLPNQWIAPSMRNQYCNVIIMLPKLTICWGWEWEQQEEKTDLAFAKWICTLGKGLGNHCIFILFGGWVKMHLWGAARCSHKCGRTQWGICSMQNSVL